MLSDGKTADPLRSVARYASVTVSILCLPFLASTMFAAQNFSQEEIRTLPRVCLAQRYVNSWLHVPVVPEPEREQWAETLGKKDYRHFHHYCAGLLMMRRGSYETTGRSQSYLRALSNFEYVERNTSSSFPLMPEVLLRKGNVLRLLGRDAEAAQAFLRATKLKSDYTPGYSALVDVYLDMGDVESAQKVLETGLKNAPNSKMLASRHNEIESRLKTKQK